MTGRDRSGRRTPTEVAVLTTGVVVVAAATAFRAWVIGGAWFFYDDFYFLQQALGHDLTPRYLVTPYNGHLMPLGFLATWLNSRAGALDFTLPAVELVAGFALTGLAVLRLLVSLFGARQAILVPLVLFCFSPILLPATTWWAAGVNQVPMLLFEVLALHAFVAYLRAPSWRPLAVHVLWLVLGLAFVERTLAVLGVLWLVALLYFAAGRLPARVAGTWRRYRAAAITHAVVAVAYLAAYVPWALNFDARTVTRRPFFDVVRDLVVTAFGSGAVGGPLRWHVSRVTQSEAHPGQLFLVAAWALIATLVVASARTRRHGARAWLLPAYALAANVALITVSRAVFFGPEIGLDFRFQTELALLWPLALGLAFLPVRGAVESAEVPETPTTAWRVDTPAWAVVGLVVFLCLAAVSSARFPLRDLAEHSPRAYYATLDRSLAAQPDARLLDLTVPPWLWAPLAFPTNSYSHMFALSPRADGRSAATVTDQAYAVDETGRLRPLAFAGARTAVPDRPAAPCLSRLDAGADRTVRLDGPVFGFGWYAEVSYRADGPGTLRLTTGGRDRYVALQPGRHTALVPTQGRYDRLAVHLGVDSEQTCLLGLRIGQVGPDLTSR